MLAVRTYETMRTASLMSVGGGLLWWPWDARVNECATQDSVVDLLLLLTLLGRQRVVVGDNRQFKLVETPHPDPVEPPQHCVVAVDCPVDEAWPQGSDESLRHTTSIKRFHETPCHQPDLVRIILYYNILLVFSNYLILAISCFLVLNTKIF